MQQHRGRFKMLTVYEVARTLDVSPDTVYRLVRRGEIGAVKLDNLIRIHPENLNTFLKSRRYVDVVGKRAARRIASPSSSGVRGVLQRRPLR